jgi:putative transposase
MSAAGRRAMLDRGQGQLSVRRQCALLGLARSGVYRAKPEHDADELLLMRRIDAVFVAWPFYGSRRIAATLSAGGEKVNRKRVQRLMRVMGIAALGPKPRTSKPGPGHKIYPYLLRDVRIERVNQVWCADITYIPMRRGFLYLVTVMDWWSRAALSWRLSNTMDAGFCVEALKDALRRHGRPEVFNTDQGSQFTCETFVGTLLGAGIAVSMDGRGRWMDNVFIERLWRSLKHEEVYLKDYADAREARAGIGAWMEFYNELRPHQALGHRMPMAVWRVGLARSAVDMPLRLDNAGALPTYPQPPQQQEEVYA